MGYTYTPNRMNYELWTHVLKWAFYLVILLNIKLANASWIEVTFERKDILKTSKCHYFHFQFDAKRVLYIFDGGPINHDLIFNKKFDYIIKTCTSGNHGLINQKLPKINNHHLVILDKFILTWLLWLGWSFWLNK